MPYNNPDNQITTMMYTCAKNRPNKQAYIHVDKTHTGQINGDDIEYMCPHCNKVWWEEGNVN